MKHLNQALLGADQLRHRRVTVILLIVLANVFLFVLFQQLKRNLLRNHWCQSQNKSSSSASNISAINITGCRGLQFEKKQFLIRIFCVEKRTNYWMVHGMENIPDRAVLRSELKKIVFQNARFLAPSKPDFFAWQLDRSRFLDCNRSLASQFLKENPDYAKTLKRVTDDAFTEFVYFRDFLYSWRIAAMLIFGSLLGWRRNCDVIPYTHDMDFAAKASEYSTEFLEALINEKRLQMWRTIGRPSYGLELSVYGRGIPFDLFFVYTETDHEWISTLSFVTPRSRIKSIFKPFTSEICTVELLGHLFMVPCNVDESVLSSYGDKWFKALRSHGTPNVVDDGEWPETVGKSFYVDFAHDKELLKRNTTSDTAAIVRRLTKEWE